MLRARIRELAHSRPRFGYQRIHILLRHEGWQAGRNQVYRLYRLEGLQVRSGYGGASGSACIAIQRRFPPA